MLCPFCNLEIAPNYEIGPMGRGAVVMLYRDKAKANHRVTAAACPACENVFLLHDDFDFVDNGDGTGRAVGSGKSLLWPRVSSHGPVPAEVPEEYASLAREAGLILNDSPRASAALSRRCLQQLLRAKAGAPPSDLYKEIDWTLQNAGLPSHVTDCLHDLRRIGNMAAHPNKSTATGDYLEVEPGEADWSLETLDALFDHYFVQPARTAARKTALQSRLNASKP